MAVSINNRKEREKKQVKRREKALDRIRSRKDQEAEAETTSAQAAKTRAQASMLDVKQQEDLVEKKNQGKARVQQMENQGAKSEQLLRNKGQIETQGLQNQGRIKAQETQNQGYMDRLNKEGELQRERDYRKIAGEGYIRGAEPNAAMENVYNTSGDGPAPNISDLDSVPQGEQGKYRFIKTTEPAGTDKNPTAERTVIHRVDRRGGTIERMVGEGGQPGGQAGGQNTESGTTEAGGINHDQTYQSNHDATYNQGQPNQQGTQGQPKKQGADRLMEGAEQAFPYAAFAADQMTQGNSGQTGGQGQNAEQGQANQQPSDQAVYQEAREMLGNNDANTPMSEQQTEYFKKLREQRPRIFQQIKRDLAGNQ